MTNQEMEQKQIVFGENRQAIEQQATTALTTNKTYLSITPTAAQNTAQIKALTRQMNGVIRLLLNQLDEVN